MHKKKSLSFVELCFLNPICSDGSLSVFSAQPINRLVMIASNTLLSQQRREMGLKEHGSDLLLGDLWAIMAHALFQVLTAEDIDVEQVLENDVKCRNEIAYNFVGDVVQAAGFPCVNLPEYVSHFAEPDSVWIDIWVKGYGLLED